MIDSDIEEFLNKEDLIFSFSWGSDPIKFPFEMTPKGFISFAKKDLELNDEQGRINSISNIKRAIDCRMEEILYVFGLFNLAKKADWSFPQKIKFMSEMNIMAPRVLEKINKKRNEMEHEFKIPTQEEVEDFLEITDLFLLSTNIFVNKEKELYEIFSESENFHPWGSMEIKYSGKIILDFMDRDKDIRKKCEIELEDYEDYKKLLKIWVKAVLEFF